MKAKVSLGMSMPDAIAGKKRFDDYIAEQMLIWTWKEVLRLWPRHPPKFKAWSRDVGEIEDERI